MTIDITELQSILFSDLKNPFSVDGWKSVSTYMSVEGRHNATIHFSKGNTSGNHFIEADSPRELFEKLSEFFKAMESMT